MQTSRNKISHLNLTDCIYIFMVFGGNMREIIVLRINIRIRTIRKGEKEGRTKAGKKGGRKESRMEEDKKRKE